MVPAWVLVGPVLLGLWAFSCWLYDNLKSLVQLVIAVLTPYFVPAENKTLVERFGKWAGKHTVGSLAGKGPSVNRNDWPAFPAHFH